MLSACTLPRNPTPTQSGSSLIYTVAAQTVNAQLTQVNQPPGTAFVLPTFTPNPFLPSPTPLPPTPLLPSATPLATAASGACDRGEFVADVNFPDNSKLNAGETFVKTWRLRNTGSCTWTTAYTLVFSGGDQMGAPAATPLTGNVAPGATIDLSVSLKAPDEGGTFRGDFRLRNATNVVFGVGNDNKPFWVQIRVPVSSGVLFDFVARADEAAATSGIGSEAGAALTFGGTREDPNGAFRIEDAVRLETGATSGKILLMFPKHDDSGYITGLFPAYSVQSGDHLRARIGFMIPSGTACGEGSVRFQVYYKEGEGDLKLLGEWTKKCNGNLLAIDLNLNDLKGKEVRFVFTVRANGDSDDDWAIWNSPRVER
jgi:hypothetical protein